MYIEDTNTYIVDTKEKPETVLIGINKVVGVNSKIIYEQTLRTIELRHEALKKASSLTNHRRR